MRIDRKTYSNIFRINILIIMSSVMTVSCIQKNETNSSHTRKSLRPYFLSEHIMEKGYVRIFEWKLNDSVFHSYRAIENHSDTAYTVVEYKSDLTKRSKQEVEITDHGFRMTGSSYFSDEGEQIYTCITPMEIPFDPGVTVPGYEFHTKMDSCFYIIEKEKLDSSFYSFQFFNGKYLSCITFESVSLSTYNDSCTHLETTYRTPTTICYAKGLGIIKKTMKYETGELTATLVGIMSREEFNERKRSANK